MNTLIPTASAAPGLTLLLSKSDFKTGCSCPTKLYFKKAGFPDARNWDAYLALLAQGGYMVENLAKIRYTDGVTIDTSRGHARAAEETLRLLGNEENITLFEATLIHNGRLARVDILNKRGSVLNLIEVKGSLLDRIGDQERFEASGSYFRNKKKPHAISADWREYLEDVTYQYTILRDLFPDADIVPYLELIDREYIADQDGLPQQFHMTRSAHGRLVDVHFDGDIAAANANRFTIATKVLGEVLELESEVRALTSQFINSLNPLTMPRPHLTAACKACEYSEPGTDGRSGFDVCWSGKADRQPLVIQLGNGGRAIDRFINESKFSIVDLNDADLPGDGVHATRQRIQVSYTKAGVEWFDRQLGAELRTVEYPLHFIDFEAARLAVPQHRGMRPYGLLAFQWSCHTQRYPGAPLEHSEWLNTDDPWPNKAFAEALRTAIGDTGTVLVWSPFEGSILKDIAGELVRFGPDPDLGQWLSRVAAPTDDEKVRILDLHKLCRKHYFHPLMNGSTSIKYVLDAIWKTSAEARARFAEVVGYEGDIEYGPYKALPTLQIGDTMHVVSEGGGAVHAYEAMMYGIEKDEPETRAAWCGLLLQYCHLDTLAMVLIYEHWLRSTNARV